MGPEETTAIHIDWADVSRRVDWSSLSRSNANAAVLQAKSASDIELLGQGLRNEVADCNRKMRHMLGMLSKIADRLSEKDAEDLAGFINDCIEEFEKGM